MMTSELITKTETTFHLLQPNAHFVYTNAMQWLGLIQRSISLIMFLIDVVALSYAMSFFFLDVRLRQNIFRSQV